MRQHRPSWQIRPKKKQKISSNVVVGRMVEGKSVLDFLNSIFVDQNDKPFSVVKIANAGELELKQMFVQHPTASHISKARKYGSDSDESSESEEEIVYVKPKEKKVKKRACCRKN